MTVATSTRQLVISLDTRIPLEAMILQRLYRLPQSRQSEWLRQLLLLGFRSECQAIRSEQALPVRAMPMRQQSTSAVMQGGYHADPIQPEPIKPEREPSPCSSGNAPSGELPMLATPSDTQKPFTHLRRVLGE